jgi:phospholipid/cholesterol/gamma-HCH transport system substrate-binding protein
MRRALGRFRRALAAEAPLLVKLGLYGVACAAVFLWLVSIVGNVDFFAEREDYQAVLDDTTGLLENDEVRIAGVEAGRVTDIDLERGRAIVSFSLDDDVELTENAQVGVRWRNVLGQKYLYLYPQDGGDALEPGEQLPIEQEVESADVGELLNALGPVLTAIDPDDANAFVQAVSEGVTGNETEVRALLGDAATVAESVGATDAEVGRIISNLDQLLGALAERDDALDSTLTDLSTLSTGLADRNDVLEDVVVQFSEVQTQLNTLLSENRGDLDGTIADLATIASTLRAHRTDLDTALATLPGGLSPYHLQSAYGQWFQVRAVIVCLANQTTCFEESPVGGIGSPGAPSLTDVVGFAQNGGALPAPVPNSPVPGTTPAAPEVPGLGDVTGPTTGEGGS